MKSIAIYGSQYGTAKAYATRFSKITGIPCVSYEDLNDINDYGQVVYFGALYAGGVKGLRRTFRQLRDRSTKTIVVTVGLADVSNKENTDHIKASLERQLGSEAYENALVFHLRGGIDYGKLSLRHRLMMKMLCQSLKSKPVEDLTQEDKELLRTYNRKVDFVNYDSLGQIVDAACRGQGQVVR